MRLLLSDCMRWDNPTFTFIYVVVILTIINVRLLSIFSMPCKLILLSLGACFLSFHKFIFVLLSLQLVDNHRIKFNIPFNFLLSNCMRSCLLKTYLYLLVILNPLIIRLLHVSPILFVYSLYVVQGLNSSRSCVRLMLTCLGVLAWAYEGTDTFLFLLQSNMGKQMDMGSGC